MTSCTKCGRDITGDRVSYDGGFTFGTGCGQCALDAEAARNRPLEPTDVLLRRAGVPMRSTELTTVRAVGGFVQTSQRFVGR